jgi:hypothetical protein
LLCIALHLRCFALLCFALHCFILLCAALHCFASLCTNYARFVHRRILYGM